MSETLPLAEIKAHLSEIVYRVEREHERVILTRNGRPAAVIIAPPIWKPSRTPSSCCPIRER